jgi:hypothetical protein
LPARISAKRWTLYVDESGSFADSEDDVAIAGLLVSDDVPGLSPAEVKKSLEKAVPGFPWPWHARLINNACWVALALADREIPSDHQDPDIRWLADAVRRVNDLFAQRYPTDYPAIRERFMSAEADAVDLVQLARFEQVLRDQCPIELDALRAHSLRAWIAVKEFAGQFAKRREVTENAAVVLLCSSETERGDAVGSPESVLGDRRYFRLLEVLVDRTAALLARRGAPHELSLDISQRNLIDPVLQRPTKQIPLYVTRELGSLTAKWKDSVRIVPRAVTPFDRHVGMRFVIVDFAANRGRRVLRQVRVSLTGVESSLSSDLGLQVRTGTPSRSHLAASGAAYSLISSPIEPTANPRVLLPPAWPRRLWACEQAWEWCRDGRR